MPKHLPSPSEKEQDPSMYNSVSALQTQQPNFCGLAAAGGGCTAQFLLGCEGILREQHWQWDPNLSALCSWHPALVQPGSSASWQHPDFGNWSAGFYSLYCLQGPYPNCIPAAEDRLGCWAKPRTVQVLGRQPDNFRGNFHSFR